METYHDFDEVSELLKSISHPVRLCILRNLYRKGEDKVSSMQCGLDLPQSTVSMHLQKLRTIGAVSSKRKGLEVYYKISDERIINILNAIGVRK